MNHFSKKVNVAALLFGLIAVYAQAQDTLHYGDPWYMYQDGYPDYYFSTARSGHMYGGEDIVSDNAIRPYAVPSYAGDGMLVYGVAVTLFESTICPLNEFAAGIWTLTERHTDWVNNSNGITYGDFQKIAATDRTGLVRTCRFSYLMDDSDGVAYCFELYFDRPVMVQDTFYPGYIQKTVTDPECTTPMAVVATISETPQPWWGPSSSPDENGKMWDMALADGLPDYWGGFFPIVKVRCTVPRAGELRWRHGDTLALGFADDGEEHDYEVVWATLTETADTNATPARSGMGDSTVVLTGLEPGTVYWYRVRRSCRIVTDSMDLTVWTPWSEGRYVPGTLTTGLGAQAAGPRFEVSPNPAQGSAQVEVEGTEAYSLELIDVHGRTVRRWAAASGSRQLALDGVPPGLYLLRLTAASGTAMRRLVVRP